MPTPLTDADPRPDLAGGTSGWPVEPRERRDFYHRIRCFPAEVRSWRSRMVDHVIGTPEVFSAVPRDASRKDVRALVDEGLSYLRELARMLALLYGSPSLGNKEDPVDELVYIILARKTREEAYQRTYETLKSEFSSWDALLDTPRGRVEQLVRSGGLSGKKTASLFGALDALRTEFGRCTLEPARSWSNEKLAGFLCSLPEIQKKSAYCIMMYSLGRQVFPVDTHVGRCLARLGPYRELGLNLEGLDHKKLQVILDDLIPPNLRHSLHVNLVSHGREVCRAPRPQCERCDIRNFCSYFRRSEVLRVEGQGGPTVVDLFCGAGGLSEGFERAGCQVLLALDQDAAALKTYRLNHPAVPDEQIVKRDIRELKHGELRKLVGRRKVDILIGAPPCQGFSHVGFRSKSTRTGYRVTGDDRNYLYEYMVAAALELAPRLFLMENVPGMESARWENLSFLEAAARQLEQRGGYRTRIWRLNAAAFGVPQDRIRYFLVASKVGAPPSAPVEDYQDQQRQDFDVDALPPVTLEEAIYDLPQREADSGEVVERWEPRGASADARFRRYLGKFDLLRDSHLLYHHTVRYHNGRDLELYALLRPGEDSIHAVERYGRHDLMRYRRDVFDDKYARLRGDRPCKTIVAHLAKDGNGYIHPAQPRSITLREAARVQSFHDGYVFCGSASDQWIQLGNAVPPVVAEAIARSFIRVLKKGGTT